MLHFLTCVFAELPTQCTSAMHNIFKKKKKDPSNSNSHHHHASGGGSNHGFHHAHHGSTSSASGSAKSSGTRPTNFSYQSLNSHLINGAIAAHADRSNNSPVLNIQQHHLSGNAPPDVNGSNSAGSKNSSSSVLFASLLPSSQKPYNSECDCYCCQGTVCQCCSLSLSLS